MLNINKYYDFDFIIISNFQFVTEYSGVRVARSLVLGVVVYPISVGHCIIQRRSQLANEV